MKNLYFRMANAFRVWWWAIKNPMTITVSYFNLLSKLLELILKVATDNKHLMTHIAYIHPAEGEKQIVSIWAGAGIGAEPTKRITELLEENMKLKLELSKHIANNGKGE